MAVPPHQLSMQHQPLFIVITSRFRLWYDNEIGYSTRLADLVNYMFKG